MAGVIAEDDSKKPTNPSQLRDLQTNERYCVMVFGDHSAAVNRQT